MVPKRRRAVFWPSKPEWSMSTKDHDFGVAIDRGACIRPREPNISIGGWCRRGSRYGGYGDVCPKRSVFIARPDGGHGDGRGAGADGGRAVAGPRGLSTRVKEPHRGPRD